MKAKTLSRTTLKRYAREGNQREVTPHRPASRKTRPEVFFTGLPCVHGHIAERYATSRQCVTCSYELAKARRLANPAKHNTQQRVWRQRNPERNAAIKSVWNKAHPEGQAKRSRAWYLANRGKANAATAAWARRNPGKRAATQNKRRCSKILRTPSWADLDAIRAVYVECARRRRAGENVEVDHIIPLQGRTVSGLHVAGNLQIIAVVSNRSKANKFNVALAA